MRSLRIAIGLVLVITSAAAADPPCKPSAQVTGDTAIVSALEVVLRGRGIVVNAATAEQAAFVSSACRRVVADVAIVDGGRLFVSITDPEGRRARRTAEDTEAAATVIESWARGDLVDPLLAARGTIEVERFGATSVDARPTALETRPRWLVAAGGDVGGSGDGALWVGARVHGCGAIGTFCIGGTVRYAIDTARSGDSEALASGRTALGITVTAERSMRRGRLSISPGVGVGLTSVTATLASEGELEQASAVHARAGIAAAFAIADAWSLRLDLDGELAPFARTRIGEADGIDRQLAASPMLQTWLGIAITYGGQ